MRCKTSLLKMIAGLAFLLGTSIAHAVATYDASSSTSAQITDVLVGGQSVTPGNWENFISTESQLSVSFNFDSEPFPDNQTSFTSSASQDDTGFFWAVSAGAGGQVSVPGFAESSGVMGIEVTITNLTDAAIEVVIDNGISAAINFSLDTAFQTLEVGSIESRSDGEGGSIAYSPAIGPSSGLGSIGPYISQTTRAIAVDTTYTFTLLARAEGRISQVPAPAPLFLIGLGLAGIGYRWRKQIKAA